MPMMGQGAPAVAKYDPSQLSKSDKMMLFGAMMHDVGNSLRGGEADSVLNTQSLLAQRQQWALQRAAMGKMMGMFGQGPTYQDGPAPAVGLPGATTSASAPGAPQGGVGDMPASLAPAPASADPGGSQASAPWAYQKPVMTSTGAPSLSDPETQRTLAGAAMMGVPGAKEIVDLLDKARPTVKVGPDGTTFDERSPSALNQHFANRTSVNGQIIDMNDAGNTNRMVPTSPTPGANPIYDNRGNVVDWQLPGGAARAISAAEAAKVGASEAAKLPYVAPTAYAQASGEGAGKLPFAGPIAQATAGGAAAGSGPYDMITVDVGGKPVTMSKAQFAAMQGVGGSPATPRIGTSQAAAALAQILPGARVTSGYRTPAFNAQVGGVTSSLHTADGALDFKPPAGANINTFRAKLAAAGLPASELIDEGTHWHWGFAPKGVGGAIQPSAGGIVGANKDDQKRVADLQAAAKQGEDLSQLGHQFMKLNGGTATGPGYSPLEIPVPFAHSEVNANLPGVIAAKLHNGIPAMDNLSTQMALALRAPGQRITQMEFQKNLSSVPGKEHLGPQNMTVVKNYDTMASNRRAYADFASNWLAQHGSLTGMDEAFRAQGRAAQPGQAAKVRTYNPKTGNLE